VSLNAVQPSAIADIPSVEVKNRAAPRDDGPSNSPCRGLGGYERVKAGVRRSPSGTDSESALPGPHSRPGEPLVRRRIELLPRWRPPAYEPHPRHRRVLRGSPRRPDRALL